MPKSDLRIASGDYAPVANRITLFYAKHPGGRIVTELVERSEAVVFKALVYRGAEDTLPAATGWASERVGDGDVNAVACLENTETSAIGRALANLGFTASAQRPSAEEIQKASRERARLVRERSPDDRGGVRRPPALDDLLGLLAEAERAGLERERADRIRARLDHGPASPAWTERAERAIRRWLVSGENPEAPL